MSIIDLFFTQNVKLFRTEIIKNNSDTNKKCFTKLCRETVEYASFVVRTEGPCVALTGVNTREMDRSDFHTIGLHKAVCFCYSPSSVSAGNGFRTRWAIPDLTLAVFSNYTGFASPVCCFLLMLIQQLLCALLNRQFY